MPRSKQITEDYEILINDLKNIYTDRLERNGEQQFIRISNDLYIRLLNEDDIMFWAYISDNKIMCIEKRNTVMFIQKENTANKVWHKLSREEQIQHIKKLCELFEKLEEERWSSYCSIGEENRETDRINIVNNFINYGRTNSLDVECSEIRR